MENGESGSFHGGDAGRETDWSSLHLLCDETVIHTNVRLDPGWFMTQVLFSTDKNFFQGAV